MSEGIDFSDDAGRAVILAGIPYAQLTDPKVDTTHSFRWSREFVRCLGEIKERFSQHPTGRTAEWIQVVLPDGYQGCESGYGTRNPT